MFRRLTTSTDGHALPKPGIVLEDLGVCPSGRTLIVQLPFGWCFFVDVAFNVSRMRFKQLRNTDTVDYNERIESDDWRDAPTRRNGSSW